MLNTMEELSSAQNSPTKDTWEDEENRRERMTYSRGAMMAFQATALGTLQGCTPAVPYAAEVVSFNFVFLMA